MKKALYSLLAIGIVLCILQVMLPAYFLTGDGPCHLYNSRILHDWWSGNNVSFYSKYYTLNNDINPNWLTHVLLSLLLYIVNGLVAEKVLLLVYVLCFVSGFYLLLKRIGTGDTLWPLVALLFVFHFVLMKGFYNFSFSIAAFFWLILTWINYLEKRNIKAVLLFFLCTCVTFFTHPMAFVFGGLTCGFLWLSFILSGALFMGEKKRALQVATTAAVLLISFLPCTLLLVWFGSRQESRPVHLQYDSGRYYDLFDFHYLISRMISEEVVAHKVAVILVTMFLLCLVLRFWVRRVRKYDGFLGSLIFALFVYLWFPDWLLGGGMLVMRSQLLVFILCCCCIAVLSTSALVVNVGALLLYGLFIWISIIHFKSEMPVSAGVADIMSANHYIRPYSVVLPLSFSNNGRDEKGNMLVDGTWLFNHAGEYLGAEKPLILLDNYEANTGYFPLRWRDNVSPYWYLSKEEGIEGNPPYAAIENFTHETGITINYVLLWCYDTSVNTKGHMPALVQELNEHYHIAYTSASKRTMLYERNN